MDEIFDKLQSVVDRYDELNELISDPEVIADTQKFMKLSKRKQIYVTRLRRIKSTKGDPTIG